MALQQQVELVLLLLVAVTILVMVARRIGVPYPILLVLGGLALGFAPGLPAVTLTPDLVFILFLPPLLYWAALTSSFRDLKAAARSISLLAVGLVVATACVVAVVAHMLFAHVAVAVDAGTHKTIVGLPWAAAFVLGAVVAPTDTVAAEAIMERLRVPRRIATVLQGESLLNDATALVLYSLAVDAVDHGGFSPWMGLLEFVKVSVGGVIIGLAVGWLIFQVRRHVHYPPVETTISLLSGFAAYIPANDLHVSGVLAVLATGLYLGRRGPRIVSSQARLQAVALWEVVVLILNGLLFILVGLQLKPILAALFATSSGSPVAHPLYDHARLDFILYAVLISAAVIVVRLIWVFPGTYLPRLLSRRVREREPYPPLRGVVVIGWTGMRGATSLAAALAIPLFVDNTKMSFPGRGLIVFLTFAVIFSTLVVQGLTLPPLIRRLRLPDDGKAEYEESKARLKATRAAMARLDALAAELAVPQDMLDDLRAHYLDNDRRFTARFRGSDDERRSLEERAEIYRRFRQELLEIERGVVVDLRNTGLINDEIMSRVQHDIDLEEVRQGG